MAGRNIDSDISWRLSSAVEFGRIEEARELIDLYGLSYSPDWSDGYTLLFEALKNEHPEIAKLLLTNGASVNDKNDNRSDTPLHLAVERGYTDIVETLLKRVANIEAKGLFSQTPLYRAIDKANIALTKLLLNKGANVHAEDRDGFTPLHIAMRNGSEFVELLLEYGANVDSKSRTHMTLLHLILCANDGSMKKSTVKIITHHIVKMEIANLHVSDENLDLTNRRYNGFRNKCKKEIALIKSEKINVDMSFYDILTKDPSSLEIYMRNENVVQAMVQTLKSRDYKIKFPIYATMIQNNFRRSMERNMLLELSERELYSLFTNSPCLPHLNLDCVKKILSFLDAKDLKTLIYLRPSNYYVAYSSFIKKHDYLFL